jgi:hypothetical protein
VVEPGAAVDVAAAWQVDLKQNYNGPLTESECKKLNDHRYEMWMHADCDAIPNPLERDGCYKNVRNERDQQMPYLIQECLRYTDRARYKCDMAATDLQTLDRCADMHPGNYGGGY